MNFRAILLILSAAIALIHTMPSEGRVSTVRIEVLDAKTDSPLKAIIMINDEPVHSKYHVLPESDSRIALSISADAGSGHYARSFTVFLEGIKSSSISYRVYLAPKPFTSIHNRATVSSATKYLSGRETDRALAILQAIDQEISSSLRASQFGVYFKYNLWRSYFESCTMRFMDYCDRAKDLGEELVREHATKASLFTAESISVREIEYHAREITDHLLRMDYQRAKWDIRRNHPEQALEALQGIIVAHGSDSEVYSRLRVREFDVRLLWRRASQMLESHLSEAQ